MLNVRFAALHNRHVGPLRGSQDASSPPGGPGVSPSFGTRLPGIEGLRALAAGTIVVLHCWLYAPPGNGPAPLGGPVDHLMPKLGYGVVLFFTLSGFLLYRPIAAAIVRGRRQPDVARYLRKRALRILPAYWVILLLCAIVFGTVLHWGASEQLVNGRLLDPAELAASAGFVQDYYPNTLLTGIGPAWSLAIEVMFYLALPALGLLGVLLARGRTQRSARRWAALAPAVLLLVLGLTGKAAAAYLVPPPAPFDGWGRNWHSVVERSFWCQADLFAFGMALAVARVDSEDGLLRLPRRWRSATIAGLLAVAVFVAAEGEGELSYSPYNTLVAAACAALLALVVLPAQDVAPSRLVRVLEWPPLIATGVVSYSIFLWHEPLIRWLDDHGLTMAGRGGLAVDIVIVTAVVGVASALTYRFVEAPALRLGSRDRVARERTRSVRA
jgi:peptidoglycan/LPS O-acetylase OafA/YrhL